jgi:hypothetical protein
VRLVGKAERVRDQRIEGARGTRQVPQLARQSDEHSVNARMVRETAQAGDLRKHELARDERRPADAKEWRGGVRVESDGEAMHRAIVAKQERPPQLAEQEFARLSMPRPIMPRLGSIAQVHDPLAAPVGRDRRLACLRGGRFERPDARHIRGEVGRHGQEPEHAVRYWTQPQGRPAVAFRAPSAAGAGVDFVDAEHAFPKRIRYRRIDADTLAARIDDNTETGRSVEWVWKRC